MYCTKCGTKIDDNSIYCSKCGNYLSNRQTMNMDSSKVQFKKNNPSSSKKSGVLKYIVITIVLLMIISISVFTYYFANSDYLKVKKQLNIAREYIDDGNYDRAIASLKNVLEIDPRNEYASEMLEQTALEMVDALMADEEYNKALELLEDLSDYLQSKKLYNKYKKINNLLKEKEEPTLVEDNEPTSTSNLEEPENELLGLAKSLLNEVDRYKANNVIYGPDDLWNNPELAAEARTHDGYGSSVGYIGDVLVAYGNYEEPWCEDYIFYYPFFSDIITAKEFPNDYDSAWNYYIDVVMPSSYSSDLPIYIGDVTTEYGNEYHVFNYDYVSDSGDYSNHSFECISIDELRKGKIRVIIVDKDAL